MKLDEIITGLRRQRDINVTVHKLYFATERCPEIEDEESKILAAAADMLEALRPRPIAEVKPVRGLMPPQTVYLCVYEGKWTVSKSDFTHFIIPPLDALPVPEEI